MKNSSILIKLASLVVSALLIMTFILPKFESIREIQDDIASYKIQSENVAQINAQLQSLVARVDSVAVSDQTALLRFMPDAVDKIAVLRTLQNITELSGVTVKDLSYGSSEAVADRNLEAHTFDFSVFGAYEVIGDFLTLLEQNEYVFEFEAVELAVDQSGVVTVGGTLLTYSLLLDDQTVASNNIR